MLSCRGIDLRPCFDTRVARASEIGCSSWFWSGSRALRLPFQAAAGGTESHFMRRSRAADINRTLRISSVELPGFKKSRRVRVSETDGSSSPEIPGDDDLVLRIASSSGGGGREFVSSERLKVVAMIALALALCNAVRVVMSVAILPLSSMHGWTTSFSGVVQSAFLWGYAISPITGGALVDLYGGKSVLAWGVVVWSLATICTPWAARISLAMLLAMRTLVGIAEGVAMPCMSNLVSRWFPSIERGRAMALSMAGFHSGSVIGLVLAPIIMAQVGLYGPFFIFGACGFPWLLLWITAISRNPESHPQISSSELLYILKGCHNSSTKGNRKTAPTSGNFHTIRLLLSKLPTWAIISANCMHNWGYFIILSWMPTYFKTVYAVNLKDASWFSAVPWAMMAVLGYVAGFCSDLLIQSGFTVIFVRKLMQSIGFLGPAVSLLGLNSSKHPWVASAWLTAAVGFSSFSQAGFLVNIHEISPEHGGILHGISNTAGTLAAIIGTVGTGIFVEWMGSFQGFLTFTAVLYCIATAFWNFCATGDRVL